ncbi:MAG: hypothetical protein GW833_03990 [Desulfuromonadales bacterium]|nr:hypothetical protein [Desulfuromonadales bacterium]
MSTAAPNPLLAKIAAYTELLVADPSSNIFVSLSEAYRKLGQLDNAHQVVSKGLVSQPQCAPGHVVLARILCQKDDLSGSVEAFLRALALEPDNLAALVGCARVYLLQQHFSAARRLLIHARELSPADPVINKLLLGLPEPALTTGPEDIQTLAAGSLPEFVSTAGNTPSARETSPSAPEFADSAEPQLDRSRVSALETVTLAELYVQQGLGTKALQIFRNLLAHDPDNLDLRRRIRELENAATAEPESQQLSKSDPVEEIETVSAPDTLPETPPEPEPESELESELEPEPFYLGASPDEPTSEHKSMAADKSVLAQLNRLLTSIQKRRGDVQGHA